jgi:hypothetical protein
MGNCEERPAAITTKDVMNVLKSNPRLRDMVDTWDNYGSVTDKNELGDHQLAAILRYQHYRDDSIAEFDAGFEVIT